MSRFRNTSKCDTYSTAFGKTGCRAETQKRLSLHSAIHFGCLKKKKKISSPYMLCHCPSVLALAPAIHSYCQLISTVPQLTTVLTCPETKLQCILVPFSLASDILHATLMHFKKKKKRLGGRIRTYYVCTVESSSLGLSRSES